MYSMVVLSCTCTFIFTIYLPLISSFSVLLTSFHFLRVYSLYLSFSLVNPRILFYLLACTDFLLLVILLSLRSLPVRTCLTTSYTNARLPRISQIVAIFSASCEDFCIAVFRPNIITLPLIYFKICCTIFQSNFVF